MNISEKVAYLKGLAEGLELEDNKEGKLIKVIIEVLDDICEEIYDTQDYCEELGEQLDAVDEDLAHLEEVIYDDEDCDCCDCDDECDCDCDCDDECYEVECPSCNDIIYLDDEMIEECKIACPNCGAELEFDFDDCDGECDCCDCDCDCEDK